MGMAVMNEELKKNIMEAVKELSLKIISFVEEEAKFQEKIEKLLQLFEVWNSYQDDIDELCWKLEDNSVQQEYCITFAF